MPPYCSFFGRCEENSNKIRHSWFKILSRRPSPALLSHKIFEAKIVQKYKNRDLCTWTLRFSQMGLGNVGA